MKYTHCDLYGGPECSDISPEFIFAIAAIITLVLLYLFFRKKKYADLFTNGTVKEMTALVLILVALGLIPIIVNILM